MALPEKDRRGYYGLIVKPGFEEALGWARKPLRIPLPDRRSKWYALSPFRAAILDAEAKFQDFEHAVHDYRQTGNELPEKAAQVQESPAGVDAGFGRMNDQAQELDERHGQQRVREMHEDHERSSAREERHHELFQRHNQGRKNPVIENEGKALHFSIGSDNEDAGPYQALRNRKHKLGRVELPQAAGRPSVRPLASFREANGQRMDSDSSAGAVQIGENESYEAARRLVEPTFSS